MSGRINEVYWKPILLATQASDGGIWIVILAYGVEFLKEGIWISSVYLSEVVRCLNEMNGLLGHDSAL